MAKTALDKLESSIGKILSEYAEDTEKNLSKAIESVTKAGVQALRTESKNKFGGSGAYAKGWKSQVETGRVLSQGVIYNTKPGLPHLLEHGHAKRGGGRVAGREHISTVENTIIEQFEKEVSSTL